MTPFTRYCVVFSFTLLILYIWASVNPSHYNWGLHYLAFFPEGFAFALLGFAGLFLLPKFRTTVLSALSRFSGRAGKLPAGPLFGALLIAWIGLIWLFPVKMHLLGDSDIILALTPDLPSIEDISANFRNQPLTYQLLRGIQWALATGGAVEPLDLYRAADTIAGVLYFALVFFFLRKRDLPPPEAALLGVLLVLRTGTQFFFGYVENYMFVYVALTAYVITGWLALERKVPLWVPLVILGLAPGFHIGAAVFIPSAAFLFLPYWKSHRTRVYAGAGAVAAAAAAMLFVLGPSWIMQRIGDALVYDFLPLTTPAGGIPYGVFSTAHLTDWANANLHIAPFGILTVFLGMILLPRRDYIADGVFRFLAFAGLTGLLMTFFVSPGLGMARDWDMLANFFIPLRILMIYVLILFLRDREARHGVLVIAAVTVIHWVAWIGINSDGDRHLRRAEMLTVPELSGTFPKLYYEQLGSTFYERKEYRKSIYWYERYVSIDSTNPRILANLSDCYRAVEDDGNVFRMLRLSRAAGSANPGVYSNLAVEHINRGDTAGGVELLREAVGLDPTAPKPHANLSIVYMNAGMYRESRTEAVEAIRLGLREPVLFRNIGYASLHLGDYGTAVKYFDEYLLMTPSDSSVRRLRNEAAKRTPEDAP